MKKKIAALGDLMGANGRQPSDIELGGLLLLGTPAQVRDEITRRIEDTGVTYYMMFAATDESWSLFSKEVLPHFAR